MYLFENLFDCFAMSSVFLFILIFSSFSSIMNFMMVCLNLHFICHLQGISFVLLFLLFKPILIALSSISISGFYAPTIFLSVVLVQSDH